QPRPDVHRGRGQGHLLLVRSHIGGSLVSLLRSLRFLLDPFRQPRSTPRPARPRHRSRPALEELETRLTPATLLNPNIVTYQDVDGDKVTVTLSKPLLTSHAVADQVFDFDSGDTSSGDATPQALNALKLFALGAAANNVAVTITAVRGATGGDGLGSVGAVDARDATANLDLGAVVVDGDLGRIETGDDDEATPGLASLTVRSMGVDLGGDSLIEGDVGRFKVRTDVVGAFIKVNDGGIGKLKIGGSPLGGAGADDGRFRVSEAISTLVINGDIVGGAGSLSGQIFCTNLVSATIGGSILGGVGLRSGEINVQVSLGSLSIGGDVVGGAGQDSGAVIGGTDITSLLIGGSIRSGTGLRNGAVSSGFDIATMLVHGSLVGNSTQPVLISA